MFKVLLLLLGALVSAFRNRADLVLGILALRQQLAAFALSGRRPRVTVADRWFWIVLRRRRARWNQDPPHARPSAQRERVLRALLNRASGRSPALDAMRRRIRQQVAAMGPRGVTSRAPDVSEHRRNEAP
jgi:hypothetical protein